MGFRFLPCMLFRGGTSKGPYFNANDLPENEADRDQALLSAMGSPDLRQIDGLGGADSLTSKVAIVSASDRPGIDVDYLFAQVAIDRAVVDVAPSCGNMLAGVAPFALETGLIEPDGEETRVMIFNVNTNSKIEAIIETPGGNINYDGAASIDGVPGTAAPIYLNFMEVVGSKTGKLLPTGQAMDTIDGIDVSCIDVAMPMVLVRAADFGLSGHEGRDEINKNRLLFELIEPIRREAGERMGLGDVSEQVIPKIGLLAPPEKGGNISSRYLTPWNVHAAHAVTGAVCLAAASAIEGTIAAEFCPELEGSPRDIVIEHPSGHIDVRLETTGEGAETDVLSAGILRTARLIMRGEVMIREG
ncbi:MAG TPA: 4-oxalomesaconate tautomerase [Rhodospirillaceae bacterium]|nr:4-oxalomesaconate tautomerase [Rhodospirillaceae bacterium]HAT35063.1 4-oxalomesaconate tautomerase [Rhodospirillaceae bacterium]